ncbi:MAG: transketolase [Solibacterales bacterium]|nr:transketolase [Bryobacterales bacterium]|tara:strand:- start:12877 stop:14733 length:1857 start_codon:yes stop_codon:yes gene_type:complete
MSEIQNSIIDGLQDKATLMRIHSIRATTEAGSGHPTSCTSAAEIMSALFFSVMRYDPQDPAHPDNDVFVLSKGHAAPVLYAAWAEAGYLSKDELLNLRKITSELEGHPPASLPFVDLATGSLGQGLSAGVGIALAARIDKRAQRVYVLLGDGESAEGSVWEAAAMASYSNVTNLCATIDINRLGQSAPTMLGHDIETYKKRWEAFGWQAFTVDGHSIEELITAYEQAAEIKDRPSVILARTFKGKGINFAEDQDNWHGKPIPRGDKADNAIQILEKQLSGKDFLWNPKLPSPTDVDSVTTVVAPEPPYALGDKIATRQAFGAALAALSGVDSRIVALDGDVKNSTFTQEIENERPNHFFQGFIAEQNMVGVAMGLAARGKIAFAASFACFLSRAYDFMRMAAISNTNVKLIGTHAGISIGEDGPSQMGLEDIAMTCAEPNYTVLYPSDGTSAWRAIELAAENEGPFYVRTSRPATPVIYDPTEEFEVGKAKVIRQSDNDQVTVIGAGVTLFEALTAHEQLKNEGINIRVIDLFSVQPIDQETLVSAVRATKGRVVTVEDHYAHGGIGDAVLSTLSTEAVKVHKLAVRGIARSGRSGELLEKFGISARHIVESVKSFLG